jgi:hypothetical protein
LQTCLVTDEKLGGHGKPYVFTHKGQELKLCCIGCLKERVCQYTRKIEKPQK